MSDKNQNINIIFNTNIDKVKYEIDGLNKSLTNINTNAEKVKQEIDDLNKSLNDTNADKVKGEIDILNKSLNDIKSNADKVKQEIDTLTKTLDNVSSDKAKEEIDSLNKSLTDINTNADKTKKDIDGLNKSLDNISSDKAKQEIETLNKSLDNINADKAKNEINNLNKSLDKVEQSEKDLHKSTTDANKGILSQTEVMGTLDKVSGGATGKLAGLAEGFTTVKNAAMSLIATPIGKGIAAVVAAFAAGKAIFDFNMSLQAANTQLKALGVSAKDMANVRSEIQATADQFDKSFEEIAKTANSLAKSYGISISEANKVITEGLIKGGSANEEFLDSISEYDAIFKNAGFSAQEFLNIINEGANLGIYTDKLPDALKEADLSLKEQTKATRDALVNAFGASFSDDILTKVRTGALTTKEALELIATESEKTGLTQQQQAQLTADIFKGAGEDAGGTLTILKAVGTASNKALDESEQGALELNEAYAKLNKSQAELFEVENFGDVWNSIKTVSIEALDAIISYIADVKKDIQPLIDLVSIGFANSWNIVKTNFKVFFDVFSGGIKLITNNVKGFVDFVKAVASGDIKGAVEAIKNTFTGTFDIIGNTFNKVKNTIIDGIQSFVKNTSTILSGLGFDVSALQKKLEGLKSKTPTSITTSVDNKVTTTEKTITKDVDPNAAANKKLKDDAAKQKAADDEKEKQDLEKKAKEKSDFMLKSEQDLAVALAITDQQKLDAEKDRNQKALDAAMKSLGLSNEEKLKVQSNFNQQYAGKQAELDTKTAKEAKDKEKKEADTLQKERDIKAGHDNELIDLDKARNLKELEAIDAQNKAKLLALEKYNLDKIEADRVAGKISDEVAAERTLNEKDRTKSAIIESNQDKLDAKAEFVISDEEYNQKLMDSAGAVLDNAVNLAGQETALGKGLLLAKQALLAAELVMNIKSSIENAKKVATDATVKSAGAGVDIAAGAAKTAASAPTPFNVPLILSYAATAVGILAAVKSATSKVKGAQAPSADVGGNASGGATPVAAVPNVSFLTSSTNQLASSITASQSQRPIKAYVVGSDVSTQQSLDRNLVDSTTIG